MGSYLSQPRFFAMLSAIYCSVLADLAEHSNPFGLRSQPVTEKEPHWRHWGREEKNRVQLG